MASIAAKEQKEFSTTTKIQGLIRGVSPSKPPRVELVCDSVATAVKLRRALVDAGFATEFTSGTSVFAWQPDGNENWIPPRKVLP